MSLLFLTILRRPFAAKKVHVLRQWGFAGKNLDRKKLLTETIALPTHQVGTANNNIWHFTNLCNLSIKNIFQGEGNI